MNPSLAKKLLISGNVPRGHYCYRESQVPLPSRHVSSWYIATMPEFFDPALEETTILNVSAATKRRPAALILACEGCSEDAGIPFDYNPIALTATPHEHSHRRKVFPPVMFPRTSWHDLPRPQFPVH